MTSLALKAIATHCKLMVRSGVFTHHKYKNITYKKISAVFHIRKEITLKRYPPHVLLKNSSNTNLSGLNCFHNVLFLELTLCKQKIFVEENCSA